jgi:hypothetical protein
MNRSLAKIGVGITLCACAALILSMGNGRTPALTYLVNMLSFVAAGINLYFFGKFLRALGWYDRKLATLLVGAGWLLVLTCFSFLGLAYGLSECAGGCGARSPKLLDWVLMLALAGIGLGFNSLLALIHSGYRAPAKDGTT